MGFCGSCEFGRTKNRAGLPLTHNAPWLAEASLVVHNRLAPGGYENRENHVSAFKKAFPRRTLVIPDGQDCPSYVVGRLNR